MVRKCRWNGNDGTKNCGEFLLSVTNQFKHKFHGSGHQPYLVHCDFEDMSWRHEIYKNKGSTLVYAIYAYTYVWDLC